MGRLDCRSVSGGFGVFCCLGSENVEAEAKAIEDQNREVEAFDSLSDDLRAFLCDLYFTGEMSREVPLDDPGVQTLLSQGFVSYARAGMVTAHPRYGRAVMVTLSKRSLRLFKNNESAGLH